jgi:hypothetical protein
MLPPPSLPSIPSSPKAREEIPGGWQFEEDFGADVSRRTACGAFYSRAATGRRYEDQS